MRYYWGRPGKPNEAVGGRRDGEEDSGARESDRDSDYWGDSKSGGG